MSLPAFSGRDATWIAADDGRPAGDAAEHPLLASQPAGHLERSSSRTVTTSSMIDVFSTSGMNPAPMPWILCGPGRSGSLRRNWRDDRRVDRLDRDRSAPTACGS